MTASLRALVQQIEAELGVEDCLRPPASTVDHIPAPLRPLYLLSNGMELPFGSIDPCEQLTNAGVGAGWLRFGFDHYFSFFLCRETPVDGRSLVSWDHDSGHPPEPVFADIEAWLVAEYRNFVEGLSFGDLQVEALTPAVRKAVVVSLLKKVTTQPSGALLRELDSLPLTIRGVPTKDAIRVVRALRELGCDCFLTAIRPEVAADA